MTAIEFIVPAIPVAQPRQRSRVIFGKGGQAFAHNYTPAKDPSNVFKATVRISCQAVFGLAPLEGPLAATLCFVMPRPQSLPKKYGIGRLPSTKKPDLDNLCKSVFDALNGILWVDDSHIQSLSCSRWVAAENEQPHVSISVASTSL